MGKLLELFNKGAREHTSFGNVNDTADLDKFWAEFEAAGSNLDKDFEAKRKAKWGLDGFKIEPKLRPKDPIKNNDEPCRKTIERHQWLQERWSMKGLQLVGEKSEDDKLTDAQRCELFNSRQAVASNKLTRLEYVLTR